MVSKNEMTAIIREVLEQDISYAEDGGRFTCEIYADAQDKMSDETATKILDAPDPMQAFWETLDEWYTEGELIYRSEYEDKIRKALTEKDGPCPDGLTDEEDAQLQEIVMELVSFHYPEKRYLEQEFCVNVMVDTGDGDYDFILNDVYPAYCGHYGEPLDNKASIVWLARTQGYTKPRLRGALKAGDMSDLGAFLKSVHTEVANVSSHMNVLTFLVHMSLQDLISLNQIIRYIKGQSTGFGRSSYIILGKESETGLFDPWNGAGGGFEVELEQDVKLPIQYIHSVLPDGGDGHSVRQVFGICSSAWHQGAIKDVWIPKRLRSAMANALSM